MRTRDLLQFSVRAMTAYPLRSSLTGLGILIGIAAVVLLTAIGEGIHRFVLSEFTQFGTHLIAVVPGKTTTFGISGATISNVRPLSLADAQALERLDGILDVVPVVQGNVRLEWGHTERRTMVFGAGHRVPEVWRMAVAAGQFLPKDDYQSARPLVVLGAKLRRELFGDRNPLGQRIRVGGDRYRVIGVMEPKGQFLGFDLDDTVFIPVDKAMELFNRESLMEIDLLYREGVAIDRLTAAIKRLLVARHGHEDFTLITQDSMLNVLDKVLNILTLAIGAIGGISLLVGGMGILTIMTITVSERVAEIGLLRAVGAERRQILWLFLSEAMALSGAGGIVGIVSGIAAVLFLKAFLPALPVELAWGYLFIALWLSLIIGLLAGVVPALRAARLDPIEALRAE